MRALDRRGFEHAGADALLLGHSFGALLALDAANLVKLDKLLVYEPYAPPEPAPSPSAATQSFQSMLGEPEALLDRFLRQILRMSDAEVEAMVPELNNILGWVEQLGEVTTDGVEPLTAVIDQKLRLRDDAVTDGGVRDAVLANAPNAQHGFFAVPKVIE